MLTNLGKAHPSSWQLWGIHVPVFLFFSVYNICNLLIFSGTSFSQTRDDVVKRADNYGPVKEFSVSNELKIIEIHRSKQNVLVEKIITILMDYGIQREQINIKQNFSPPRCKLYVSHYHFFFTDVLSKFVVPKNKLSIWYLLYSCLMFVEILFAAVFGYETCSEDEESIDDYWWTQYDLDSWLPRKFLFKTAVTVPTV